MCFCEALIVNDTFPTVIDQIKFQQKLALTAFLIDSYQNLDISDLQTENMATFTQQKNMVLTRDVFVNLKV